jgi:predicted tellurium resistance membrane protein TerC
VKIFWALLVGFFVGTAISVCAGFVQADRTQYQGHTVYYGVPLAIVILVATLLWLNRLFQSRFAGVGVLVAWMIATWQLATETADGDLGLVPASHSHVYMIAGSVCLGIGATWPVLRPVRAVVSDQSYPLAMHGNESG